MAWIFWFLIGLISATCILLFEFKEKEEIYVSDLFIFFIIAIMGYASVVFPILYIFGKYDDFIIYKKNKNKNKNTEN